MVIFEIYDEKIKFLYELRQQDAGNKPNFDVVQTNKYVSRGRGGFTWDDAEEGYDFWESILEDGIHSDYYDDLVKKAVRLGCGNEISLEDLNNL